MSSQFAAEMEETIFCKNCRRGIPSAAFTLHNLHCSKNIVICKKCQEPVAKAELEAHDKDAHAMVRCNLCQMDVENCLLSEHKDDCPSRLIPCEYCEMDCPASEIESHQAVCGSRTELCDICHNFIQVKVLSSHIELHNKKSSVSFEKKAVDNLPFSHLAINSLTGFNESIMGIQNGFQAAALPIQHDFLADGQDEIVHIPCEFCQENFPLYALEEHQVLCGTTLEKCDRCHCSVERNRRNDHVCYAQSQANMNTRQSDDEDEYWSKYGATPPKNVESVRDSPPPPLIDVNDEEVYWSKYPTAGPKDEPVDDDDPSIPCEICSIPFPLSCLETHEIACKFGAGSDEFEKLPIVAQLPEQRFLVPCSFCNVAIVAESLEKHESECSRSVKPKEKAVEPHIIKPEPVDAVCSICDVVVSTDLLELHELRCARLPKEVKSSVKVASPVPKPPRQNTRPETASQRAQREAILAATQIRQETNPVIPQSKMVVLQLPNGDQILKKRHNDDSNVDIGNRLGHGTRFGSHDRSTNEERNSSPRMKMDQMMSSSSVTSRLFKSPSFDQVAKKSNSAFMKNDFEPETGSNGGRYNRVPSPENGNRAYFGNLNRLYDARQGGDMDKELGARPKQPMKPRIHNDLDGQKRDADRPPQIRSYAASDVQRKLPTSTTKSPESNGMGPNKKSNVAFKTNAYEPDPGRVLGRRSNHSGTNDKY